MLEITRAAGRDTGDTARGEVTLRLNGETRKVPFTLTGARAEVGTVRVFFTSRLEPLDNRRAAGPPPGHRTLLEYPLDSARELRHPWPP